MDIVQNSIRAGAKLVAIRLHADSDLDQLLVEIEDNGSGMSQEMLDHVTDPFVTSRTTRRVGLGLSLLQAGAEGTGGSFCVSSELGRGTTVRAVYTLSSIDRPPCGDFAGTAHSIIVCNPNLDFLIDVKLPGTDGGIVDTREVRRVLGTEVRLDEPDVSEWLKQSIEELFPPEYECF